MNRKLKERIIEAMEGVNMGHPLKDYLDFWEVEEALSYLVEIWAEEEKDAKAPQE